MIEEKPLLGTFLSFTWTLNASLVVLAADKRQDRVLFMAWTTGFLSLSHRVSGGGPAWWCAFFVPLLLPFVLFFCKPMRVKEKLYGCLSIRQLAGLYSGTRLKVNSRIYEQKGGGFTSRLCKDWYLVRFFYEKDVNRREIERDIYICRSTSPSSLLSHIC